MELTGGVRVVEFLNVELPSVQARRLDLVLLLANGPLLHIELQSSNDRDMRLRMLDTLVSATLVRDIREWQAEDLLASSLFGDQVLALLGGTSDPQGVVRGVLERIAKMGFEDVDFRRL